VHDATAGALGETSIFGSYPGSGNILYVIAGTGIGTRLLVNGQPFYGGEEINYMHNEGPHHLLFNGDYKNPDYRYVALETKGRILTTKYPNGQDLEYRTSGPAIAEYAKQVFINIINVIEAKDARVARDALALLALSEKEKSSKFSTENIANLTCEILGKAANGGNQLAKDIIQARAKELGIGLAVLIMESHKQWGNAFSLPEHIIIGSGVAQIGQIFLDAVKEGARQRFTLDYKYLAERMELSQIKDDTGRELLGGLPTQSEMDEFANKMSSSSEQTESASPLKENIKTLRKGNWFDRAKAAEKLGQIGGEDLEAAVVALKEALNDESSHVRRAVAKALDNLDWKPKTQEEKIIYLIAREDWLALIEIGEPAVKYVVKLLYDSDPLIPSHAVETLGQIGGEGVVVPLVNALWSKDSFVRSGAVVALIKIGEPAAVVKSLIGLLGTFEEKDTYPFAAAIEALDGIGQPAIEPLREFSQREDPYTELERKMARGLLKKLEIRFKNVKGSGSSGFSNQSIQKKSESAGLLISAEISLRIATLVRELEEAKRSKNNISIIKIRKDIDELISKANEISRQTYDQMAEKYTNLRGKTPSDRDLKMLNKFINLLRKRKATPEEKVGVLDVGTGLRDMTWFSEQNDVAPIGIDFSEGVIKTIRQQSDLDARIMDMTDLNFSDDKFLGVRCNASLHHLPLIDEEQGADVAIKEAYRVLKPGGIYYVLVKSETDERKGFMAVDTQEDLGERFYQFYNKELLKNLLEHHGFVLLEDIEEITDSRGEKNLIAFAEKPTAGSPLALESQIEYLVNRSSFPWHWENRKSTLIDLERFVKNHIAELTIGQQMKIIEHIKAVEQETDSKELKKTASECLKEIKPITIEAEKVKLANDVTIADLISHFLSPWDLPIRRLAIKNLFTFVEKHKQELTDGQVGKIREHIQAVKGESDSKTLRETAAYCLEQLDSMGLNTAGSPVENKQNKINKLKERITGLKGELGRERAKRQMWEEKIKQSLDKSVHTYYSPHERRDMEEVPPLIDSIIWKIEREIATLESQLSRLLNVIKHISPAGTENEGISGSQMTLGQIISALCLTFGSNTFWRQKISGRDMECSIHIPPPWSDYDFYRDSEMKNKKVQLKIFTERRKTTRSFTFITLLRYKARTTTLKNS